VHRAGAGHFLRGVAAELTAHYAAVMPGSRGSAVGRTIVVTASCALLGALMAGCGVSPAAVSRPVYTYTCCSASLTAKPWHPGQQVRVVWIEQRTTANRSHLVATLTVVLTGPYRTVSALKTANRAGAKPDPRLAVAQEAQILSRPTRPPVSIIRIPAGATPGYYNLDTIVSIAGGTVSGSSVVTIVP